ncbi:MAG TPA: AAA family ATPase [Sphingobacteriaceae bacterium]
MEPTPHFNLCSTSSKMDLSNVFSNRSGASINEYMLYVAHFNTIPNIVIEKGIDCRRGNKWFSQNLRSEVKDHYFIKRQLGSSKHAEIDDILYFIYDDLMVNFDTNNETVRFLFKKTDTVKVDTIIKSLKRFPVRNKRTPAISLLINTSDGIDTKCLEITRPRLNINDNYNDDFLPIHQNIIKRLSKKNDKGLILLHGKPGTGKTSYIRYLIATVKKNIIFLPPNMAAAITAPNLIGVLIDNPNSVFVIEDAENIIVHREENGSSPVSALLNISDGLLSDCLNIQIICSFNTDISKVDSALLRKGRLIARYEFKELAIPKAQTLSDKLGFSTRIDSPQTLTSIYNQEEHEYQQIQPKCTIGFRSNVLN